MTAYNGHAITYDTIGNPTVWYDGTQFTWVNGRRLASAAKDSDTYTYTYNSDGLRLSKTVNGVQHKYIWQGDTLLSENYGDTTLEFFYDESGAPSSFTYKASANASPTTYYYITNLQGDVVKIIDASGNVAAEYAYNAWGIVSSATGSMADINPIRYRSYYYDVETKWYYLQSRYYDPELCRFINADSFASTDIDSVLSANMFAYCENNPTVYSDHSGNSPLLALAVICVVGLLLSSDNENASIERKHAQKNK